MPEGVCAKCGFKAPAGLLKCPFCRIYIRQPGSSSSTELKVPQIQTTRPPTPGSDLAKVEKLDDRVEKLDDKIDEPPANAPPPDPDVVRAVQREIARQLFDDSSYEWKTGDEPPPGAPGASPLASG